MHIIEMRAENFKRISLVQIAPEGGLVQVTGANAQGKTTVLDAFWAALGGLEAIPNDPVRTGKTGGLIRLKIGTGKDVQYIVERRLVPGPGKQPQIIVRGPDGAKYPSPQELLNGFMGQIAFDPIHFMNMKPKEQFAMLRGIVTLDVDMDALDRQRGMLFEGAWPGLVAPLPTAGAGNG